MIILWGSKQGGKSTFLAALDIQIHNTRNAKSSWVIETNEVHADHFLKNAYDQLTVKCEFPRSTNPGDVKEHCYEFLMKERRKRGLLAGTLLGKVVKYPSRHLNVLDPAGEFFEQPELEKRFDNIITKCLKRASGVICLIDPMRPDVNKTGKYVQQLRANLKKLRHALQPDAEDDFQEIPIPTAFCLTKMDQFPDWFDRPGEFIAQKMPQCMAILDMYYDPEMVRYFSSTSVGLTNGVPNLVLNEAGYFRPLRNIKPAGVLETVEWIFHHPKYVEKRGADMEPGND